MNQGSDETFNLQLDLASDGGLEFNSNEVRIKLDGSTLDRTSNGIKLSEENLNASLNSFTASLAHGDVDFKGSGIVSSSGQINSLINDTIAATIVAEIDNDEIPIAKLARMQSQSVVLQ